VSWDDPDTGRVRTEAFAKKAPAEAFDAEIRAQIGRGAYLDPASGRITVNEYAVLFRAGLLLRESSKEEVERAHRLHVAPVFGGMAMSAVRSGTIKRWVQRCLTLDKPLAPSTIHKIYTAAVHPLFAQAVLDRIIGESPCRGVALPPLPKGIYDLPTVDQVHALAAAVPRRYRAAVYLAAGCGWRSGEIMGLELDGVDFLRREARVSHQLAELSKGAPFLAPPKTETSYRTTELPTLVQEMLSRHIAEFPPKPCEVLDKTNPHKPRWRTAHLLFPGPTNKPFRRTDWSKVWRAACEEAKIPADLLTLRSMRHYFATALIYGGKNVKTVQMACGHASPSVTLETYLGYWPGDERDSTRGLLDAALDLSRTESVPAAHS
jgi:integrase